MFEELKAALQNLVNHVELTEQCKNDNSPKLSNTVNQCNVKLSLPVSKTEVQYI
jgi:hypothetical protein